MMHVLQYGHEPRTAFIILAQPLGILAELVFILLFSVIPIRSCPASVKSGLSVKHLDRLGMRPKYMPLC